jgi:hypothetical protein
MVIGFGLLVLVQLPGMTSLVTFRRYCGRGRIKDEAKARLSVSALKVPGFARHHLRQGQFSASRILRFDFLLGKSGLGFLCEPFKVCDLADLSFVIQPQTIGPPGRFPVFLEVFATDLRGISQDPSEAYPCPVIASHGRGIK